MSKKSIIVEFLRLQATIIYRIIEHAWSLERVASMNLFEKEWYHRWVSEFRKKMILFGSNCYNRNLPHFLTTLQQKHSLGFFLRGLWCDCLCNKFLNSNHYVNLELFWSVFSRIWTEYREILRISPYSVRMRENADQKNSESGHFSRSE